MKLQESQCGRSNGSSVPCRPTRSATLSCVSSRMWPQFVAVKKTSEPHLGLSLADRDRLHSWPSPGVTPHLLLLLSAEAAVTETGMMCACVLCKLLLVV